MINKKEAEETKPKESEGSEREEQVPVEVHHARSESSYAASETSDERLKS